MGIVSRVTTGRDLIRAAASAAVAGKDPLASHSSEIDTASSPAERRSQLELGHQLLDREVGAKVELEPTLALRVKGSTDRGPERIDGPALDALLRDHGIASNPSALAVSDAKL